MCHCPLFNLTFFGLSLFLQFRLAICNARLISHNGPDKSANIARGFPFYDRGSPEKSEIPNRQFPVFFSVSRKHFCIFRNLFWPRIPGENIRSAEISWRTHKLALFSRSLLLSVSARSRPRKAPKKSIGISKSQNQLLPVWCFLKSKMRNLFPVFHFRFKMQQSYPADKSFKRTKKGDQGIRMSQCQADGDFFLLFIHVLEFKTE